MVRNRNKTGARVSSSSPGYSKSVGANLQRPFCITPFELRLDKHVRYEAIFPLHDLLTAYYMIINDYGSFDEFPGPLCVHNCDRSYRSYIRT